MEYVIGVTEIMDSNGELKEVLEVHGSDILVCNSRSGELEKAVAYMYGVRTVEISEKVRNVLDAVIRRSEIVLERKVNGYKISRIVEDIGINEDRVREIIEVNSETMGDMEKELQKRALKLYIDGMSRDGIAKELGITYTKAKSLLYRDAIKEMQRKEEKRVINKIINSKTCSSLEELAKEEGYSRATVYKMLERNGMSTRISELREAAVVEQIAKMLESGCKIWLISKRLKCTEETVRKKIKMYGLNN